MADGTLCDGGVGLFGEVLALLGVEPASMREPLHQDPLVGREVYPAHEWCPLVGLLLDLVVAELPPSQVLVGVGILASVHAVRAVDLVDLAGLPVLEVLVPADAVVAADGIRGRTDAVGGGVALHGFVQQVSVVSHWDILFRFASHFFSPLTQNLRQLVYLVGIIAHFNLFVKPR